jgi:hypothetical protein
VCNFSLYIIGFAVVIRRGWFIGKERHGGSCFKIGERNRRNGGRRTLFYFGAPSSCFFVGPSSNRYVPFSNGIIIFLMPFFVYGFVVL